MGALARYLSRPEVLARLELALRPGASSQEGQGLLSSTSADDFSSILGALSNEQVRQLLIRSRGSGDDPQYRELISCFPPEPVVIAVPPMLPEPLGREPPNTKLPPVDIAILTFREDEYRAVLDRFPAAEVDSRRRRTYMSDWVWNRHGLAFRVAIVRTAAQGPSAAQATAQAAIADLDPTWLLLAGIAGAVPSTEFTLGDVVVATTLHAFTVGAQLEGGRSEFSDQGGPMTRDMEDLVLMIPALRRELVGWDSPKSLTVDRPSVDLRPRLFYGSKEWRRKTKAGLQYNLARTTPIVTERAVASSGLLVRDPDLIAQWRSMARDVEAVEMELAGVFEAARQRAKEYPILAIRGISDVVGYDRDPGWTAYACHTAASFAVTFLSNMPWDRLRPKAARPKGRRTARKAGLTSRPAIPPAVF
jgi:nucleoside phosphorylase